MMINYLLRMLSLKAETDILNECLFLIELKISFDLSMY